MLFMITPDLSKINEFWKNVLIPREKSYGDFYVKKISVLQQKPEKMASTITILIAGGPDRKAQRIYRVFKKTVPGTLFVFSG